VKKTRQTKEIEPPFRFNRNGKGSAQPRSGNRSIPRVESCASAAATLRPAMRRSGAISASGTSTKARSNSRGAATSVPAFESQRRHRRSDRGPGCADPSAFHSPDRGRTSFDLVQGEQQRVRIEAGFDFDAGIDETGCCSSPRAGSHSRTNGPAVLPASCRRYWRSLPEMSRGRRRHCRQARSGRQPMRGLLPAAGQEPRASSKSRRSARGLVDGNLDGADAWKCAQQASATAPAARSSSL